MIPEPANHDANPPFRYAAERAVERVAAQVVAVEGEGLWIEVVEPRGGCGRCFEPGGCGGLSLSHGCAQRRFWFPLTHCAVPLAEGDPVWVETAAGAPLAAAWHTYGLPLLLALAGSAAVHRSVADLLSRGAADALAATIFVVGLLAGWWRSARRLAPVVRLVPRAQP